MIKKDLRSLKVALVTDSMNMFGGSDRLLFSIMKIFPNSTIFTPYFNPKSYKEKNLNIRTSILDKFRILSRHLNSLSFFLFEQFSFKGFDIVISLSAGPSKAIITDIYQPHIGIILTPPRNIWDKELNVRGSKLRSLYIVISNWIFHYLRIIDTVSFKRIDHPIVISRYIQQKVKKIYKIEAEVIYPGISEEFFQKDSVEKINMIKKKYNLKKDFLLTVSRLYDHKRIDWSIRACIKTKTHLYIVGKGPDFKNLKRIAQNSQFIHFLDWVPDDEVKILHQLSNAFLFCALEDFGYVTLESLAMGKPVIGLNSGGTKEIVLDNITGRLISTEEELSKVISQKAWKRYNPEDCIKRAREFSEEKFHFKLIEYIQRLYEKEKRD